MSSAAAARFAARYDLPEIPSATAEEGSCPTCPADFEDVGTPLKPSKMADLLGFSGQCPTRPTCPTDSEEDGDEIRSGERPPGEMMAWLREGELLEQLAEPGERPAMTVQDWPTRVEQSVPEVDAWGLTAEQRAASLARLRQRAAPAGSAEAERDVLGPVEIVPQTIPHDVMMAGLLAASRIRPSVRQCTRDPADDPWQARVDQLREIPAPVGFSVHRWQQVHRDCAALLAAWGAEMRRLGWDIEDGFGIDPEVPADVHCYGLGTLLKGGTVVEMTATGATIERPNGIRQSFVRRYVAARMHGSSINHVGPVGHVGHT